MEIDRGKQLQAKLNQKPQGSAQRALPNGRVPAYGDSASHREQTLFYEDLTNVMVLDVKPQKSAYFDLDDWVLLCLYTYKDVVTPEAPTKSDISVDICINISDNPFYSNFIPSSPLQRPQVRSRR